VVELPTLGTNLTVQATVTGSKSLGIAHHPLFDRESNCDWGIMSPLSPALDWYTAPGHGQDDYLVLKVSAIICKLLCAGGCRWQFYRLGSLQGLECAG